MEFLKVKETLACDYLSFIQLIFLELVKNLRDTSCKKCQIISDKWSELEIIQYICQKIADYSAINEWNSMTK